MYVPGAFAETDPTRLHDFMRQHSFAILTSTGPNGLFASHLPLLLDTQVGGQGQLLGHMARANPQWKVAEGEVMVVFAGPHAYVSPAYYEEAGTVPTWNYAAVHAYGNFRIVEERGELLEILERTVGFYESPMPEPWRFDESDAHVEPMLKAIIGFRIEITRLEGKWKLNQNHPEERRRRVVRALERRPDDDSKAVAALMAGGISPPSAD